MLVNYVDDLINALQKEYEIYKELTKIADDKKQIIIDGKIKELDKITIREQGLAMSLVKLENYREKVINKIMKDLNIKNIDTITELITHLDQDSKNKLNTVKNQLIGIIDDIKNKNELNSQLIDQSLKFIDFNIGLLAGIEEDNKYASDGKDPKFIQRKSLFDAKA
ncbi:flagellar protein FlgN [Helicovermis profundi]|uniref:Flagellar protein FlgN n=1 Tax=Helicovermis profundi TaxID=3065157 RepID=A0AAU9E664_9FIRM|nr:flagellar protein FlgN [Clostridia bacterium S502]